MKRAGANQQAFRVLYLDDRADPALGSEHPVADLCSRAHRARRRPCHRPVHSCVPGTSADATPARSGRTAADEAAADAHAPWPKWRRHQESTLPYSLRAESNGRRSSLRVRRLPTSLTVLAGLDTRARLEPGATACGARHRSPTEGRYRAIGRELWTVDTREIGLAIIHTMRKDVRQFIRRLEAQGLTVEPTTGHYHVYRDGRPLASQTGCPSRCRSRRTRLAGAAPRSSTCAS